MLVFADGRLHIGSSWMSLDEKELMLLDLCIASIPTTSYFIQWIHCSELEWLMTDSG